MGGVCPSGPAAPGGGCGGPGLSRDVGVWGPLPPAAPLRRLLPLLLLSWRWVRWLGVVAGCAPSSFRPPLPPLVGVGAPPPPPPLSPPLPFWLRSFSSRRHFARRLENQTWNRGAKRR